MSGSAEDLRAELLRRAAVDQAARASVGRGDPEAVARGLRVDADNTSWLKTVIEEVGWPGYALVGEEAAHAAWLLAQHADQEPEFQRGCLQLMESAVAHSDVSASDLAYLTDRVLVNGGRPQRFGTQLTARDGAFVAQRLEDAASVDSLRAAVGLEPLEAHIARATEHCGAPQPLLIACRDCEADVATWPPPPGQASTVTCPSCGRRMTVRVHLPLTAVSSSSNPS